MPSEPSSRRPYGLNKRTTQEDVIEGLDVFGLGQAMIDFGAAVSDDSLPNFNVVKGGRRVISIDERYQIQHQFSDGFHLQAGGSITNTLIALSQLSNSDSRGLRLGFAGCIGSDYLGDSYIKELARNEIQMLSKNTQNEALTGCVIVLTTPDAQRSFLVYPGNTRFTLTDQMKSKISKSKVLLIEGYLLGLPDTLSEIQEAISVAKQSGTLVVLTGGDSQVIKNSLDSFWKIIHQGIDMFLCNHSESVALLNKRRCKSITAKDTIEELAKNFLITAVTDGSNGSYLAANNQVHWVEAVTSKGRPPVDTCGAGDVYAAGLLFGFLLGYDIHKMGLIASRSALSIISRPGAQLTLLEAKEIIDDIKKTQVKVKTRTMYVELNEGVKQEA